MSIFDADSVLGFINVLDIMKSGAQRTHTLTTLTQVLDFTLNGVLRCGVLRFDGCVQQQQQQQHQNFNSEKVYTNTFTLGVKPLYQTNTHSG